MGESLRPVPNSALREMVAVLWFVRYLCSSALSRSTRGLLCDGEEDFDLFTMDPTRSFSLFYSPLQSARRILISVLRLLADIQTETDHQAILLNHLVSLRWMQTNLVLNLSPSINNPLRLDATTLLSPGAPSSTLSAPAALSASAHLSAGDERLCSGLLSRTARTYQKKDAEFYSEGCLLGL